MTNKEIEQKYSKAFSHAVPDVFDAILKECNNPTCEKTVIVPMNIPKKPMWQKMISVAAAIVIILTAGFVGSKITSNNAVKVKPETVDSIVSLDVNPSIELLINDNERIIEAKALNDDAKTVIGDMDFSGSNLSLAVNAIIGSMVRNGYIDELSNAILISVDSDNEKQGTKLQKKLEKEVNKILSIEGFKGQVISQTVKKDEKLSKLAEEYGITNGKAQLIQQIIDKEPKYSFTELASLSIHQLNQIASGEKVEISYNSHSEKERIGKAKAKKIALGAAGLEDTQIYNYKCELNDESKALVYVVKFDTLDDPYSYTIDAYSGEITDSRKDTGTYFGREKAKALALEAVGATENEITNLKYSLDNYNYGIIFKLGLVKYIVEIDKHTGEVVSISPKIPKDNITQGYISESDVKKIILEEIDLTEDELIDYKCVLTKNGKLPVFEVTFKYATTYVYREGVVDSIYLIAATTGEIVGNNGEFIEQQTTIESSKSESGTTDSNVASSSQPASSQAIGSAGTVTSD